MRVFVPGATGFIGSAVVHELTTAGHEVLGLARSDASADKLAQLGAEAHRGDLSDLDSLAAGARECDGVIHTAFIHDFSQYEANAQTDRQALAAMAGALEGSDKPLVATSGTTVLAPGRTGTEEDSPSPESPGIIRAASEEVLAFADRGVRVSAVRLAPSVHGDGDSAFVPAMIGIARAKQVSAYIGDGSNRWPAVHRLDAARLFRLALENGAAGSRFHGAADEGVPVRDIAAVIARRLNVPLVSMSPDEAGEHFDWLANFLAIDNPISSALTRERLGWHPVQPALLTDLDRPAYFEP